MAYKFVPSLSFAEGYKQFVRQTRTTQENSVLCAAKFEAGYQIEIPKQQSPVARSHISYSYDAGLESRTGIVCSD
jgi:hypothetical protein